MILGVALVLAITGIATTQVFADQSGIPNFNAGDNPFKHCVTNPGGTLHCGE
jgi:hypothetical protein